MSIYLYENDKRTGPFSEDQILQMLQAAIVSPDTLGWKEGMPGWERLSSFVLLPNKGGPPTPPRRNSPLGIISFIFSLVSAVAWLVLLIVAGIARKAGTTTHTFNIILGVFFMGGIFLNFVALILGVIGSFKSNVNTLAIIGACLNGFILISLVVLIYLGLAAKHGY